jgi:hypothetical protein
VAAVAIKKGQMQGLLTEIVNLAEEARLWLPYRVFKVYKAQKARDKEEPLDSVEMTDADHEGNEEEERPPAGDEEATDDNALRGRPNVKDEDESSAGGGVRQTSEREEG